MSKENVSWDECLESVNKCLKEYPTSIEQIKLLEDALGSIANWDEHPSDLGINKGSKGVQNFYRNIAIKALEDSDALLSQLQEEKG